MEPATGDAPAEAGEESARIAARASGAIFTVAAASAPDPRPKAVRSLRRLIVKSGVAMAINQGAMSIQSPRHLTGLPVKGCAVEACHVILVTLA
jgi:hypothetical protein